MRPSWAVSGTHVVTAPARDDAAAGRAHGYPAGRAHGGPVDGIVLATSTDSLTIRWRSSPGRSASRSRGPLDDVLATRARHRAVRARRIVRFTADCPLTSPTVIDAVIGVLPPATSTTARTPPTFPRRADAEVVRPASWSMSLASLTMLPSASTSPWGCIAVRSGTAKHAGTVDLSSLRWTVDTPDDLAFVTSVYESCTRPTLPSTWRMLALIEREPGLSRTTADEVRNGPVDLDTGAMNA